MLCFDDQSPAASISVFWTESLAVNYPLGTTRSPLALPDRQFLPHSFLDEPTDDVAVRSDRPGAQEPEVGPAIGGEYDVGRSGIRR
jgi:hypothetical protein